MVILYYSVFNSENLACFTLPTFKLFGLAHPVEHHGSVNIISVLIGIGKAEPATIFCVKNRYNSSGEKPRRIAWRTIKTWRTECEMRWTSCPAFKKRG
jgi:hypothetical protein